MPFDRRALVINRQRLFWIVVIAVVLVPAIVVNVRTVHDLSVPYDPDHYRDVSQAQTALDGTPWADQFYKGELLWYNPLLPWTIALGSKLLHVQPLTFHVAAGPWLNLIGAIGLLLLATSEFGSAAAVSAAVAYLYLTCHHEVCWICATYAPWLFVSQPAEGLFLIGLWALMMATRRQSTRWYVAAGALAGLAFLAHSAPGVLLLAIFVVEAVTGLRRHPNQIHRRFVLAYVFACAIVALPYLGVIGARYQFHIRNAAPMSWDIPEMSPGRFPTLFANVPSFVLLGAALGVVCLPFERRPAARAVLTWFALATGLMFSGIVRNSKAVNAWALPPSVVPTFHWWLYVTLAISLLFGVGCGAIVKRCRPKPLWTAALLGALAVAVYREWIPYVTRLDILVSREMAQQMSGEYVTINRFIRRTTRSSDVFLATYGAALVLVGPAGRKTVAVQPAFSNPYVDYEARAADRDAMFRDLELGDVDGFRRIAEKYEVTHVIGNGIDYCHAIQAKSKAVVEPFYEFTGFCILQVTKPR